MKGGGLTSFSHQPVLLEEVLDMLCINPAGIYVDATAGGAGHSAEIAKRLKSGRLIAIDRDPDAVETARLRLAPYHADVLNANYSEILRILEEKGISGVDGILMDLGVSSFQLDHVQRGFTYQTDAPLDMRMSKRGDSAADLIRRLTKEELSDILHRYGEERYAGRIAAAIVRAREEKEISSTAELAEIIIRSVPAAYRRQENPCRRTFQAIRIAVNGELDHLKKGLNGAFESLKPGGVLTVITFHSLEDRIVKHQFASWAKGCTCPSDFPVCVCGNLPRGELIKRKPVTASDEELRRNPRSRSAKLRGIRKVEKQTDD